MEPPLMGSMTMPAGMLFGSLSDFVGAKSGLALARTDINRLLEKHDGETRYNDYADDRILRMESVVYDEMVETLLFAVGRLERRQNFLPMAQLIRKYGREGSNAKIAMEIARRFVDFTSAALASEETKANKAIDPSPFMMECWQKHGKLGLEMAEIIIDSMSTQVMLRGSLVPGVKEVKETIALKELFASEGLEAQFGEFFDQRYIDYLHRNFDDIDAMNWRKFEALTAEYFIKMGFSVELGPGRGDDGIDVRAWSKDTDKDKPPSIIVQCKREKKAISKGVVKALYADVLHEKATSGLLVTTSSLSPGARKTCEARSYPVKEADRKTIQRWLEEMRKPGAGVIS
jgi:restriction system protein